MQLSAMLTAARGVLVWLGEGASVPQQTIGDFAMSPAKALEDVKDWLPDRQLARMPRPRKRCRSTVRLEYAQRGVRFKDGGAPGRGIAVTVVWSPDLPCDPSSVRILCDSLDH